MRTDVVCFERFFLFFGNGLPVVFFLFFFRTSTSLIVFLFFSGILFSLGCASAARAQQERKSRVLPLFLSICSFFFI